MKINAAEGPFTTLTEGPNCYYVNGFVGGPFTRVWFARGVWLVSTWTHDGEMIGDAILVN